MAPIVEWALAALEAATPAMCDGAGLDKFGEYRKSWTGVSNAWPPIAVVAKATQFDPEGQLRHQAHEITIRFGVTGSDPEQVVADAFAYMSIIDRAIEGAAWPEPTEENPNGITFGRVFVAQHDYGPLYVGKDGGFARFPEMHIEVEVYEV